jgi:hypothetical protein
MTTVNRKGQMVQAKVTLFCGSCGHADYEHTHEYCIVHDYQRKEPCLCSKFSYETRESLIAKGQQVFPW